MWGRAPVTRRTEAKRPNLANYTVCMYSIGLGQRFPIDDFSEPL